MSFDPPFPFFLPSSICCFPPFFPPIRTGRQGTFHVFTFQGRGGPNSLVSLVVLRVLDGNFSKRMIFIERERERERLSWHWSTLSNLVTINKVDERRVTARNLESFSFFNSVWLDHRSFFLIDRAISQLHLYSSISILSKTAQFSYDCILSLIVQLWTRSLNAITPGVIINFIDAAA